MVRQFVNDMHQKLHQHNGIIAANFAVAVAVGIFLSGIVQHNRTSTGFVQQDCIGDVHSSVEVEVAVEGGGFGLGGRCGGLVGSCSGLFCCGSFGLFAVVAVVCSAVVVVLCFVVVAVVCFVTVVSVCFAVVVVCSGVVVVVCSVVVCFAVVVVSVVVSVVVVVTILFKDTKGISFSAA